MELKKEFPQFDELDKEFSKNCTVLYNILTSNFNKRIKLIEASRDDLYEWLAQKLKGSKKWNIKKSASVDEVFPKHKKDGKLRKFEVDADNEDIGIYATIDLENKTKLNTGLQIEIGFGLEEVTWSIGQFRGLENKEEYLDYKFYKKANNAIPKSNKYETNISFPNILGVEDVEGQKYIEVSVRTEDLNQELAIRVQRLIKTKILTLMVAHLKQNS